VKVRHDDGVLEEERPVADGYPRREVHGRGSAVKR
jgi:hypothetical protein